MRNMYDVIVLGGGAAGMMAAWVASTKKCKTLLIEQNEKLGKKLYITGKGRCNLTNACDANKLMDGVVKNPKFLFSAFSVFNNKDLVEILKKNGLETVVEQGGRIFPKSGRSSDVIRFFQRKLSENNVEVLLHTKASRIIIQENKVKGVMLENGDVLEAKKVVLTTGGKSYPLTGSRGDGYKMAEETGHTIVKPYPALVAMVVRPSSLYNLQGLSLKNVSVTAYKKNKKIASHFGELLFTHDGISGPIILNLSAFISQYADVVLKLDLKPALTEEKLERRILRDFEKFPNSDIGNALKDLLPKRLIAPVLTLAGIDKEKKTNQISVEERKKLIRALKQMPFAIEKSRGFDEAIITGGGVDVKEISPATLESKIVSGLYFAGEILDVHAVTGGYNLQITFSTAYLAASKMAESLEDSEKIFR